MKEIYRKLQISMLWVYLAVGTPAGLALILIEPGVMREFVRTGEYEGTEITKAMGIQLAVFVIVPMVMAFLTFVLPYAANRISNIAVGLVIAVFNGLDVVSHLGEGQFGGEVLMVITMTLVALLIPVLAWWLPAPETVKPQAPTPARERERAHV